MKIAAVIPAYNEEKTLPAVLQPVLACSGLSEVIVVDDGSTDNTAAVAEDMGARVLSLSPNAGKGGAVAAGFRSTDADVILLLDADLTGLTESHILTLLQPIRDGAADMTLGIFSSGRLLTNLAQKIAPQLTGQRAVRRAVLEAVSGLEMTRFGVEIALNRYARNVTLKTEIVLLPGMSHVMKEEKMGFFAGFCSRLHMYWNILRCYRDRC
ncbi:MAG: glycosyltransferase family 2 protein [bacterium]|jgi:glycosyltransferase involved in cell wall biosynthesis